MNKFFRKQLLENFDLHEEAAREFPGIETTSNSADRNDLISLINNNLFTDIVPEKLYSEDTIDKLFLDAVRSREQSLTQGPRKPVLFFKRVLAFGLPAAALLAFVFISGIFKQPAGKAYQVLLRKGNPAIRVNGKLLTYKKNTTLPGNIHIVTDEKSSIKLVFGKTHIYLQKNSLLNLHPIRGEKGSCASSIALECGTAVFSVEKNMFQVFKINIPGGTVRVLGTVFSVNITGKTSRVAVLKGTVILEPLLGKAVHVMGSEAIVVIESKQIQKAPNAAANRHFRELFNLMKQVTQSSGKGKDPARKITGKKTRIRKSSLKFKRKFIPVRKGFRESITLKNGTVLSGNIVSQASDKIRLKTSFGIVNIPWSDIKKVAYIK